MFVFVLTNIQSVELVQDFSSLIMMPGGDLEFVTKTREQKDTVLTFTALHEGSACFLASF